MAILLNLNRPDFEYDVWTLVRAFYNDTEVVTKSEKVDENLIEFTIDVKITNSKITVSISGEKKISCSEKY